VADILDQLVDSRNLLGLLGDPLVLVLLFAVVRALTLRALRVLPRTGAFSGWSSDVEQMTRRLLSLTLGLALLGDLALNLYLVRERLDLIDTKLDFFGRVYAQYSDVLWLYLGVATFAVIANIVLLQLFNKLLPALVRWAQNLDAIKGNDAAIAATFERLRWGVERTSWLYLLALGASKLAFLPPAIPDALSVGLRIFIIYTIVRIAWSSLEIGLRTFEGLAKQAAAKREKLRFYESLRPLFPSLRRALEAVIVVVGSSFAVAQIQGFETIAGFSVIGLRIVGLLFAAQVLSTLFEVLLRETLIRQDSQDQEEMSRRLTVLPLVASIAKYVIFGFAIVTALGEIGIDPLPVLAGVGVAGVAIGFGAQSLITDLVSGIFILWESYFVVGDYVAIEDREGVVESISLRVTSLRDDAGRVHIIPNGKIEGLVNYSKGYVAAEVSVTVPYETDIDEAYAALEEVSTWVRENVPDALEAPEIEGVDELGELGVVINLSTKVKPGRHTVTARIVRKRVKEVFTARSIAFAQPRRVIHLQGAGALGLVEPRSSSRVAGQP
jgi:small-conductance mechanosensitive channel